MENIHVEKKKKKENVVGNVYINKVEKGRRCNAKRGGEGIWEERRFCSKNLLGKRKKIGLQILEAAVSCIEILCVWAESETIIIIIIIGVVGGFPWVVSFSLFNT